MSDFSNCPACADGKLQWTYVTLGAETVRAHGCNKCNYEFWEPKITVSSLGIPSIYTPLQVTPSVFSESKNEMSNEELLDLLIRAANDNNEFDNRSDLEYYRLQVLSRMKITKKVTNNG